MKMKLFKVALPWLALAVLSVLVLSLTAVTVEAGCCGGAPEGPCHIFRVYVSPDGGGDVEVGDKLPGSYPYVHLIEEDEVVYIEAKPADGYYFVGWSGDLSGAENPAEVTIVAETNVTAHFFPEEIVSEDNRLQIIFREGTVVQDEDGARLFDIELDVAATPPPPPTGAEIVGSVYELGPHGASFDRLATLNLSYDPAEIPSGVAEEDLVLGYYDEDSGEWLVLRSDIEASRDTLSTRFDHLSTFAVIAPDPQSPAAFTVSALNVSPTETEIGETVTVSVLVTNSGELEGSYVLNLVVNGTLVETRGITMASGSQEEFFSVARDTAGSYTVEINGLSGSFTVREAPPAVSKEEKEGLSGTVTWTLVGLAIAAFVVLVVVIIVKTRRRHDDFYYYW